MDSFLTTDELKKMGFFKYGKNVHISRKASFYGCETISIGDNVRIDDFCILSGKINIGDYVHISAYSALYGTKGIILEGYCGISPRCVILSASDDFSGDYLIGAQFPAEFTNVRGGPVVLKKYSQLGTNTIVFPNVTISEGAVTGAMTLVNKTLKPWTINTGIPVNRTYTRKNGLESMINTITIQNNSIKMEGGGKTIVLLPVCA